MQSQFINGQKNKQIIPNGSLFHVSPPAAS